MKYLLNIFKCLHRAEKRKLLLFSLGDALTSLLDLGALAALLWILNRETGSLWPALALLLLFAIKNVWAYRLSVWQYRFIYQVGLRISEQELIQYLEQDYLSFVQTDSSIHIHRVKHQPIEFAQYELRGLQQILAQSLLITLTIGALLWYQPILFLWLVGLLLPVCLCATALIKTTMNKARRSVKETGQSSLQHLQETIGAYIEINTYRKADFFLKRFLHQERDFTHILSRQQSLQGFPSRFMEVFAVGGLVLLLFLHHQLSGSGAIPLVMIGAFMGAAYKIIPGLVIIINSAGLLKAYAYTERHTETTASPSEEDPLTEPLRSIQIDGLSFHYGPNIIFKDLHLHMESGDCIALKGFSGRGKTTLAHLLLGFLEPASGTICFNDVPTDAATRRRFWTRMAYMQQKPFLFNDSILKNITLEEVTANKAKLRSVTKATGLVGSGQHDSNGLRRGALDIKRVIKENGKALSGGQRQRIAFARALYKEADLVILDEPFSELDIEMERRMLQEVKRLASEGKMILLITHHVQQTPYCNKIVSLDEA
jgi:ABC-type multidrug transport system fused ATPase/permease subunit